jgi:hypothetical protein
VHEATSSAAVTPEPQVHGLLGFTGSRDRMDEQEQYFWLDFLQGLEGWKGFVTGGCVGFDDFVGRTLVEIFPTHIHRVYVPADRSRVAAWWRDPKLAPFVEIREMASGTTYKDRNQALVDDVAALVANPKYTEDDPMSGRSGTWQTIRMARRAMKPVIYHNGSL